MQTVKHIIKRMIYIILFALCTELTICNLPHWRTLADTPVPISFDQLEHGSAYSFLLIPADNLFHTIGIDAYTANGAEAWSNSMGEQYTVITSHAIDIVLEASDGSGNFLGVVASKRIGSRPGVMEYIFFNLPEQADYLKVCFYGVNSSEIICNDVCYNGNVPLHLSAGRLLLCVLLFSFLTLFGRKSRLWTYPLFQKNDTTAGTAGASHPVPSRWTIPSVCITLLLNILLILLLITINPVYFRGNAGFEPYIHLAHALAQGNTAVDLEVSDALLAMENPYDAAARAALGVKYAFDYAYYEGHYYVYFGVVPCLLLYLPYYLATGADLPNWCAVAFFAIAMAVSLSYLLYQLCRRYYKTVSLGIFLIEYELLLAGSMLFYVLADSSSYCIPMIAALFFITMGIALWACAAASGSRHMKRYLFLGSLMMALSAGCRPQLTFSAVLAYPLLRSVMLPHRPAGNSTASHPLLHRWICFLLPFMIVAVPLMYYNWIRFGSVVDFGAGYNLTSINIHDIPVSFHRIPSGITYYLLDPPRLSGNFPFVESTDFAPGIAGDIIFKHGYGGLLFWNPALWTIAVFYAIRRKKNIRLSGDLILMQWMLSALGILLLVFVTIMGMGGLMYRYMIDFSLFLSLTAALLSLCLYNHTEPAGKGFCGRQLLVFCLLITLCFQLLIYVQGDVWPLRDADPDLFARIADTIEFWK